MTDDAIAIDAMLALTGEIDSGAPGAAVTVALLGRDMKGKISPVICALAIPLGFVNPWIAVGLYVVVSLMWLVPDRRIESRINPA